MSRAEVEEAYAIGRRIEAEERGLDSAVMVLTSTLQEVDQQWGLYDGWVGGGWLLAAVREGWGMQGGCWAASAGRAWSSA
jgi:hypothetical protein